MAMGMRVDNSAITKPLVDAYTKTIDALGSRLEASNGVPLGAPEPDTELRPSPALGNLDAALVALDHEEGLELLLGTGYWRWRANEEPVAPIGDVGELDALIHIDQLPVYLHPPAVLGAPRRLRLEYLETGFDQPSRYDRATVLVSEVLVFRPHGGATQPGYSGSPVVAGNLLVGMHIAGIAQAGIRRSYVIPAYQVFPSGLSGYSLDIATDRIES